MSKTFYIAVNGQQLGPYNFDELKSQNIRRETLVWTEGIENWKKAEEIEGLKNLFSAVPPPLPKTEQAKPPKSEPLPFSTASFSSSTSYFGYVLAGRRERFFADLIWMFILMIPFSVFLVALVDEDEYVTVTITIGLTVLSTVFGAVLYPNWGGHLGHKIMGIQVISADTGKVLTDSKMGAIREFVKNILGIFILPVMWLLWDKDRQNLYDKLLRTYVVKKKWG